MKTGGWNTAWVETERPKPPRVNDRYVYWYGVYIWEYFGKVSYPGASLSARGSWQDVGSSAVVRQVQSWHAAQAEDSGVATRAMHGRA